MLGENAMLLEVRAAPPQDGYGDATGDGDIIWTGRVVGHLRRRRRMVAGPGGVATLVEADELIVRTSAGGPTGVWVPGPATNASTIVVEDRRFLPPIARRFRIAGWSVRAGGGTIADSVTLELGDGGA